MYEKPPETSKRAEKESSWAVGRDEGLRVSAQDGRIAWERARDMVSAALSLRGNG